MQDTQRNIHTKFGFNWSSSVRGEEFWKNVNDDDGRQVMAIAHMAFDQVSSKMQIYAIPEYIQEQIKLSILMCV